MMVGFEKHLLDACIPQRGLRVLDVGCGAGTTTLAAARRVAPEGLAVGVDIDPDAVALAASRARMALLPQAQFRCDDAATAHFEGFDRVVSRFGVLHFADPVRAFGNLRRSLVADGQLGFICAREPALNPWATRPIPVVQAVLGPLPQPTPNSGPFALADQGRIRGILGAAGFTNVRLEVLNDEVLLGANVDDVIEFFFETELRKLDLPLSAPQAFAIEDGLREALADWQRHDGVRAPASAWLVTANPS